MDSNFANVTNICWSGESQMPIIHFLMEFRLRPLSGAGEDWVSLVIPANSAADTQTYLLRGLTPGKKSAHTNTLSYSTFGNYNFKNF